MAGFKRWEQERATWLSHKALQIDSTTASELSSKTTTLTSTTTSSRRNKGAMDVDVDEIIDIIFSNRWKTSDNAEDDDGSFPLAVPLPQMVDILVDLWEAEGLEI